MKSKEICDLCTKNTDIDDLNSVLFNYDTASGILHLLGETLDSVSTVFNEIAQHPPHTLFAICNWSIGHPR